MRYLDPLLPYLFPCWPFKKCPPHNNKTCLTIVNVVPLVFSIPDDEDCSQARCWETDPERACGGGGGLLEV